MDLQTITASTKPATHTPGPWNRNQYGHLFAMVPCAPVLPGTTCTESRTICNLQGNPNINADASLIAAAPELLKALLEIEYALDRDSVRDARSIQALYKARAAIAKATGA